MKVDLQNRAPTVTRTPDFRNHVERRYDVENSVPKTPAAILAECWLPLGTADAQYTDCYLIEQRVEGQNGDFYKPCDFEPILVRIFEQLDGTNETLIGQPSVVVDQYGNTSAIYEYWQLNLGTAIYQVPGTTTAPAPFTDCVLKTEERTNDGTLRKIRRTYINRGLLSDTERLLFGGRLILRELTYLNQIPPTPSGWVLTTQSTEFVNGLPVYRYGFVNSGGGGGGAGGAIGISTRYDQSVDQGATTGTTVTTIRQISDPSVAVNPIATPSGMVLISVGYEDDTGYRLWTAVYAKGTGTVVTRVYGREDFSLVYEVTSLGAASATPAYPGSGTAYLVSLTHDVDSGYFINRATYIKPPPTTAFRKQRVFPMPGLAYFVGTDLILQPATEQTLLATETVSYDVTQDTTTPFSVTKWAGFTETYTPTDTGIAINNQFGLNGYLATGTTIFGSGTYKGVDCSAYTATRFASSPTSLPTGTTTIGVMNEAYLTDINGVVVFRRTVTTVSL